MFLFDIVHNRAKTSSPATAVEALLVELPDELRTKTSRLLADFNQLPLLWSHVGKLLQVLESDIISAWKRTYPENAWENHALQGWEKLVSLCRIRIAGEDNARKMLASPSAFSLWAEIGHLNSKGIKSRFKNWLSEMKIPMGEINLDENIDSYGSWLGMAEVVRSAYKFHLQELENHPIPGLEEHPNAHDWEDVLIYIQSTHWQNNHNSDCDKFGKCEVCWRFVPHGKAADHHKLFCDQHQWNTTEYKRALQVMILTDRYGYFDSPIKTLHRKTLKRWIADHHNLPEDWAQLLRDDVVALSERISTSVEYPTETLKQFFPYVCAFVAKNGRELTSLEIVDILDPIPAGLSEDIASRWKALHHVFASNLALFRKELCYAEIFMQEYDRLFSKPCP